VEGAGEPARALRKRKRKRKRKPEIPDRSFTKTLRLT
jgi:hypothetical protein